MTDYRQAAARLDMTADYAKELHEKLTKAESKLAQVERDYSASQAHVAELSLEERDLRAELQRLTDAPAPAEFVYRERQTMTDLIDKYFGPAPTKITDEHHS